jgi:hypothetical protein
MSNLYGTTEKVDASFRLLKRLLESVDDAFGATASFGIESLSHCQYCLATQLRRPLPKDDPFAAKSVASDILCGAVQDVHCK